VSGRIPDIKKAGLSGRISGASLVFFYKFVVIFDYCQVLKENGACKVYVMATHGILSNEAPRLIEVTLNSYPVQEIKFLLYIKQQNVTLANSVADPGCFIPDPGSGSLTFF
jgi:hypothetical protein